MCLSGLTRTTRTHDVFARASLRVGVSFDLPRFGLVKADNWLDDTGTVFEFAGIGLRNVTCRLPLAIGAVSISGNNVNGHRGFLVTRTHDILPCKSTFTPLTTVVVNFQQLGVSVDRDLKSAYPNHSTFVDISGVCCA